MSFQNKVVLTKETLKRVEIKQFIGLSLVTFLEADEQI